MFDEDRVAQIILGVAVALMIALGLGFAVWTTVSNAYPVLAIYRSLSQPEQAQLQRLFNSAVFLLTGTVLAYRFASWALRRRRRVAASAS